MSTQQKTVWYRMVERILPKSWLQRPPPNPERNDSVLAQLSDSDPTYRALQDHAFDRFSNEIADALDITKAPVVRISHLDRAAGISAFLTGVDNVRDGVKAQEELNRKQREAAAKQRAQR